MEPLWAFARLEDWGPALARLHALYGWTGAEIGRQTLPQLLNALMQGKPVGADRRRVDSLAEAFENFRARKQMGI